MFKVGNKDTETVSMSLMGPLNTVCLTYSSDHLLLKRYYYVIWLHIEKTSKKKRNICGFKKFCVFLFIYIYIFGFFQDSNWPRPCHKLSPPIFRDF